MRLRRGIVMTKQKGYEPVVRRNGERGSEFIQNTIRFPPHIYQHLRDSAEQTGRSLHAEILHRVVTSLGLDPLPASESNGGLTIQEMAADIKALRALAEQFMQRSA